MIDAIGAELVEDIEEACTATHVIASDGKSKLRRTPKLMICMCKVPNILSIEWLEQSSSERTILDANDFLLLDDKEAEERYNFSMKESLRNGILARRERGGVLGGWSVYICSGVAGNEAPSLKELHLIIKAAGGQVLESLTKSTILDPTMIIVLTSNPSTESQLSEYGVERVVRLGAKTLTTSWLFHTIITQQLSCIDGRDNVPNVGRQNSQSSVLHSADTKNSPNSDSHENYEQKASFEETGSRKKRNRKSPRSCSLQRLGGINIDPPQIFESSKGRMQNHVSPALMPRQGGNHSYCSSPEEHCEQDLGKRNGQETRKGTPRSTLRKAFIHFDDSDEDE